MHLMNTNEVDARFSEIKALAKAEQPLSDEGLQSAADLAAYETVRGIFSDLHFRRMSTAELTARGNRARAQYIRDKRSELLDKLIYKQHQEAYQQAQASCAKLCKWTDADGDGAALLDTLEVYIHAISGEASPVTAKAICDVLRANLLQSAAGPTEERKAAKEKKQSAAKAKRFIPPTLEEVKAYFAEKRLKSDPEEFFDFYEGSGWKRGRGVQIKDWKATANNWERKEAEFTRQKNQSGRQKGSVYSSDASYDLEAYRQSAIGLRDYKPKAETA